MEGAISRKPNFAAPAHENGKQALTCASQVDIDCAEKNGFDETDKKYLEELAALLGRACDW